MATRIELIPSIPSWAERPQDFDGVVEALSEGDAEVVFTEPPPAPDSYPQAAGMDFVIWLTEVGPDAVPYVLGWLVPKVGDALLAAAKRHKRKTPMMGVIYGPDGEVLKEVTVMAPDDEQ